MREDRVELFGLELPALEQLFSTLGLARYRARQVYQWLYRRYVYDFAAMTDLRKGDRELLAATCSLLPSRLQVVRSQQSADGLTTKLLLQYPDGCQVESVLMEHDYGYSACLSSQVGCPMGCRFCASGRQGLERNLAKEELLAQAALFSARLASEGKRLARLVVMGSGEPFLNYDNVLGALDFCHQPEAWGLSYRHMTISTCGLVPGIERLAREGRPINLAISLHSVRHKVRAALMPVEEAYPFPAVLQAAAAYAAARGRQVTYEYILLAGLNDGEEDGRLLASYLAGQGAVVNLIPANPVPERGLRRPTPQACQRFCRLLRRLGLNATLRREMGGDIAAACGQLRGAGQRGRRDEGEDVSAGNQ